MKNEAILVPGDMIITHVDDDVDITKGKPYLVLSCDENVVVFRDDCGDKRRRFIRRYERFHEHIDMSDGAQEYEEAMKGEEVWASIRTNSGN